MNIAGVPCQQINRFTLANRLIKEQQHVRLNFSAAYQCVVKIQINPVIFKAEAEPAEQGSINFYVKLVIKQFNILIHCVVDA